MSYNWQQKDWPRFRFKQEGFEDLLFQFAEDSGKVSGVLQGLSAVDQLEAVIFNRVLEAMKTSEIEGEYLSRQDVMSSIRNHLGLNSILELVKDQKAAGVSELMINARETYAEKLDATMLFNWHRMLMKGNATIKVAVWRSDKEPMQVVSGAIGLEVVHFQAPPSGSVPTLMEEFIQWFNETAPGGLKTIKSGPIRAALVHLYFETIHPFEDGNGRIGRALAEKSLAQSLGRPVLLSLSHSIEKAKKKYYQALESAQGDNEVTDWLHYFISTLVDAQQDVQAQIGFVLKTGKFFDRFRSQLNPRQMKVIKRMIAAGPKGFEGGINARKYIGIAKTSKATATRDLQDLLTKGVLEAYGGGRNTSYQLDY